MGYLDYFSNLCEFSHGRRKFKKRQQLQTVEIKVKIDCEGCERKLKKVAGGMKGVTSVQVEPKQHKLTVVGYVDPNKVVRRVRMRTGKTAELWPYVPYDAVAHPYAPGAYDKKAPPGYVRDVMAGSDPKKASAAMASSTEEHMSNAFSDENPNSCSVM
ncbi:heavy metal-associated isoprenylated plant protein 26-like [Aristolochia californica]|uniref:heavy metal-associated isoprenylated plant protein 26-like n=1 Tax=Aristolochia californica TaxID=171875 RepID=UPI0035D53057